MVWVEKCNQLMNFVKTVTKTCMMRRKVLIFHDLYSTNKVSKLTGAETKTFRVKNNAGEKYRSEKFRCIIGIGVNEKI